MGRHVRFFRGDLKLMKRLLAFAFLFALCAGTAPALANDPSCVLENCEKTDIAKEAAKTMNKASGTDVTRIPPQEIIKSIEREIAAEPKRPAAPANKTPRKNAYNQPESCDYYAESRNRFRQELVDYKAHLEQEQLRIRAEVIAYGQKLRDDDAAMKVKMAELREGFLEDQRRQAQHSADYQIQMKAESVAFEAKAAEYGEQLAAAQDQMRCPPDEAYTKFLNTGYSTKWNP